MAEDIEMMQVTNASKAFGEDWSRESVVEGLNLTINQMNLQR